MSRKVFFKTALTVGIGTAGALLAKDKAERWLSDETNKKIAVNKADKAVMRVIRALSDKVSDNALPYLNRYDNTGFLEGNGYFLADPAPDAKWQLGYAKGDIVPYAYSGDLYVGGYLAYPANRVSGFITHQYVRCIALDDSSGRGIHVFAVIDCIGLANSDVRIIRNRLADLIQEKNILSLNISATHCHSGVDTEGLWGDLLRSLKTNTKTVKSAKTVGDSVSGRNIEFMDYLYTIAEQTVRTAVNNMKPGSLSYSLKDAGAYSYDKRPPYITDKTMTVLRFIPDDGGTPTQAVFFAAHPTNYGDKQREVSADFPYFLCEKLEKQGYQALYFQGAQAAIAAQFSPFAPDNGTTHERIIAYGEALADLSLNESMGSFVPIAPLINVCLSEVFIPADNPILTLAGKLKLVQNNITKVAMDGKAYDLYFPTEVGMAELGKDLKLALIPGEMRPDIAVGGVPDETQSYTGEPWRFKPLQDAVQGRLTVIGLCNDEIGYIVPDNDFGSVFAPLHYEESVSAGKATASNITACFFRVCEKAQKIRINKKQIQE